MWNLMKDMLFTVLLTANSLFDPCNVDGVKKGMEMALGDSLGEVKVYPMKVGDYNREVVNNFGTIKGKALSLSYPDDTIAFVILREAEYGVRGNSEAILRKPLYTYATMYQREKCGMASSLKLVVEKSGWFGIPSVHLPTAAHVAGGAYYYQASSVEEKPDSWQGKTITGVSLSVEYGNSTVISGIVVATNLRDAKFEALKPIDVVPSQEERIAMLSEKNML